MAYPTYTSLCKSMALLSLNKGMETALSCLFLLSFHMTMSGQDIIPNSPEAWTKVINADIISFYGYEWRGFEYSLGDKVGKTVTKQKIKNGMYLASEKNIEKYPKLYFVKSMKNRLIIYDPKTCLRLIDGIEIGVLLHLDENKFIINEIQRFINTYKLKDSEGIGYIAFVNYYVQCDHKMAVSHVFFDIETREILTWTGIKSDSGKGSIENRMRSALDGNIVYFLENYYRMKRKEYFKKN